ncbi:hypothetical protein GG344DRAFT_64133 [Lentinula edodes]|nr:hypothetical protein GG344DRAFT_64133 [Lentinula edodes]
MDTRVVELLKIYLEEPLAFVNMLTKTKSMVGGQFVLRFLNVSAEKVNTPLLIFAPRLSEESGSDFMLKKHLICTVVRVPHIFKDYCAKYMKIEGKNGAQIRILVGQRSSPLAMILGFGDTIGCSFINGSGVYVGNPDDVTEGKVVIGNTDAGTGRHLWSGEMVENRERDAEVEYWQWNTGRPCQNLRTMEHWVVDLYERLIEASVRK